MKKMEFLYQPRGAGKRTVKPSKDSDNLEALVGGGDSGSDDSDFEVGKHSDDNSDIESDSGGDTAKSGDDDDDSDDEDSEEDDQEEDDLMQLKKDLSTKELIDVAASQKLQATVTSSQGLNTVKVCGACLCNSSDDINEIVECDGCGISVHEGCYGIQDSGSITSTASSDPTEPWFCEPCRANVKEPECELCPNRGGIYKETDVRKWIHLVCGLYVPNCNFFDPEGLSKATLFEINYGNWGRRICGICKDVKYARTGVCIECDAGMCKQYFHVSCAQENGLLSEPKSDDQDSYFGHCKLHSDKEMIKKRKKNWLTHLFQSKQRGARIQFEQSIEAEDSGGGETGAQRTLRKLEKQRSRWTAARVVRDDPWVPTQKMPRLLTTSSSAMKKLSNKVDLQEWDSEQLEREQAAAQSVVDIRKKWNIAPAWSVEFVAYYHDRNNRIKSLQESLAKGVTANNEAKDEQIIVTSEYSRLLKESEAHRQTGEKLANIILSYHNLLKKAAPDKKIPPIAALGQRGKSPVKSKGSKTLSHTPSQPTSSQGTRRGESSRTSISSSVSMSSPTPGSVGLLSCAVCKQNNDQHLLAKCDVCKMFYHIGCLNPPLARMPKKTKQYGWQCSECDEKKDTAVDANNVTVTGPRASRLRTNPRMSFDLGDSDDVESLFKESLVSPSEDLVSRGRKGKRGLSLEAHQIEDGPTPVKRSRKSRKSGSETSVNNNKDVDKPLTNSVPGAEVSRNVSISSSPVISSALENTKSKYSSPTISVSSDMHPITSVSNATNLSENEVGNGEISRDPVSNLPPKKSFKNKAILKDMSGVLNSAEVISPTKSSKKELVESNSAVSSPNSSGKRKPVTSVQNKTEFSDEIFHALHNGVVDEVTDSPKHNFSEVAVNCLNTMNTHNSSSLKMRVESPKPGKTNSTDLSQHFPQLNSPVDVKITRGDRKAAKAAFNEEAALAKAKEEKLKEAAATKAREEKALKEAAATKAREEKALREEKAAKSLEEKTLKEAAAAKAREEKALKDAEAAAKLKKDKELAVAEKALREAAAVKIKKDKEVAAAKVREEKAAKALEEKEAAAVKAREEKVNKELAVVKQKEEKGAAAKVRELLQAADAKEREEKEAADVKAREDAAAEKMQKEKEAADKLSAESSSNKESVGISVDDASKKYEFEADLRLCAVDPGVMSSKDSQIGTNDQIGAAIKASDVESAAAVKANADGSSTNSAATDSAALAEIEAAKAAAKMEKKRKKREEKERRKEEKRKLKAMLQPELNDEEPEMEMEEDEDGNCVFRIAPRPIKLKIKPLPPPPKPSDKPANPEPVTTSNKISNGGENEAHSWRSVDPFHAASSVDPFHASSSVDAFHASSSVDTFQATSSLDSFQATSPPKSAEPPPKNHVSEITHMHPKKKMAHLESLNNSLNYINASFPASSCPVTSTVVSGGEPPKPAPPPATDPPPVAVVSNPPDPPPVNTPEAPKASPVRERPKRTPSSSSKKGRDVRTKCDVCFQEGSNLTLVRCDECKKCYHFMCLLPPIKKSPKLPGWSWHCTDCDPSDTDTGWHL